MAIREHFWSDEPVGLAWDESETKVCGVRTRKRSDAGFSLLATALSIIVLLAITGIAVDVARLTTTATEVQVAADAGALAGALAISQGLNTQAASRGQAAAARNSADGRLVDTSGVQIDVGNYNADPDANPHFSTSCTAGVDCNATRATVTVDNVKYIMAAMPILGGGSETSVTKTAVAAVQCQGSASPLPLAVCRSDLTAIPTNELCGPLSSSLDIKPDLAQTACWTSLSSNSSSASFVQSIFPPQCGGTPLYTILGQPIELHSGLSDDVFKALQCCIQCQDIHDFTVPVINCTGTCAGAPPVIGFATLHIANATDVSRSTNGDTACNSFTFCSNGVKVTNAGISQIQASQVCKSNLLGAPGGANCGTDNFGNSVAPVMGQLP